MKYFIDRHGTKVLVPTQDSFDSDLSEVGLSTFADVTYDSDGNPALVDGSHLVYNADTGTWVPEIPYNTLSALKDVNVNPSDQQTLVYDAINNEWKSGQIPATVGEGVIGASLRKDSFIGAQDSETEFVLSFACYGEILGFRNGVSIPDGSFIVDSDGAGTLLARYVRDANGDEILRAGDRIDIQYIYNNESALGITLDMLNDVNTSLIQPRDKYVLTWDSETSKWYPEEGGTGGGILSYDSDAYWKQDDLVVYQDMIYAANTDKTGSGQPFTIADAGDNTWRKIGGETVVAEYWYGGIGSGHDVSEAQNIVFDNVKANYGGISHASNGVFSVTSAGTYKINYRVQFSYYTAVYAVFGIWDVDNEYWIEKTVSQSMERTVNESPNDSGSAILELPAGGRFAIALHNTSDNTAVYARGGLSFVNIEKIAGFEPVIGFKPVHATLGIKTWATSLTGTHVLSIANQTGNVKLSADEQSIILPENGTYRLNVQLAQKTQSGFNSWVQYALKDNDSGDLLPYRGHNTSVSSTGNSSVSGIDCFYTVNNAPASLSIVNVQGNGTLGSDFTNHGSITVEKVDNQSPIYKDYSAIYFNAHTNSSTESLNGPKQIDLSLIPQEVNVGNFAYSDKEIVIPEKGTYKINYSTMLLSTVTGDYLSYHYMYRVRGGSLYEIDRKEVTLTTDERETVNLSAIFEAEAGDTIRVDSTFGSTTTIYFPSVNISKIAGHLPMVSKLEGISDVAVTQPERGDILTLNENGRWDKTEFVSIDFKGVGFTTLNEYMLLCKAHPDGNINVSGSTQVDVTGLHGTFTIGRGAAGHTNETSMYEISISTGYYTSELGMYTRKAGVRNLGEVAGYNYDMLHGIHKVNHNGQEYFAVETRRAGGTNSAVGSFVGTITGQRDPNMFKIVNTDNSDTTYVENTYFVPCPASLGRLRYQKHSDYSTNYNTWVQSPYCDWFSVGMTAVSDAARFHFLKATIAHINGRSSEAGTMWSEGNTFAANTDRYIAVGGAANHQAHGIDFDEADIRVSSSQDNMVSGYFEEFRVTHIVGSGYNNNLVIIDHK